MNMSLKNRIHADKIKLCRYALQLFYASDAWAWGDDRIAMNDYDGAEI